MGSNPTSSASTTAASCQAEHQRQVNRLIAGPGVYICNQCVEIIAKELPKA